jgi:general secretion pathway protein D
MIVKNTLPILLLLLVGGIGLRAQDSAAPPPELPPGASPDSARRSEAVRKAIAARAAAATNATNAPSGQPPTATPVGTAVPFDPSGRPPPPPPGGRPLDPNSIVVPSANPPPDLTKPQPDQIAITPSASASNSTMDQVIEVGTIDFKGVDLNQVLKIYAEYVNKTILRPATLAGAPVWLTTQTPLTKREVIQAFDAVLGMSGIAMIPFGDKFIKADAVPTANQAGSPFNKLDAAHLPEFGSYVTHVVQLHYAKPSDLIPVLTPFGKIPGGVTAVESTQMLVLRDFTENVKRMLEMIHEIDKQVDAEYIQEVIPIRYAKAVDIAGALNSLSSGGGGATVGSGGGGTSRSTTSRGVGGFGNNRPGGIGSTYPGQTQPGAFGQQPQAATPAPAASSSFTDRLAGVIKKINSQGEFQILGQTKMIADERTNSLLIFASREDMKMITNIVAKLDVVLAQVLIETVIISVTLDDGHNVGVSYIQKPQTVGQWTGVGAGGAGNQFFSPGSFINGGASNAASGLVGGFNYLFSVNDDLDVSIQAAAHNNKSKILQRPRIQTSHNEPATIFVGQSRPYPTGSSYGGAYGSYSTIQQLQIGVTLEVTPLINVEGLVVMDIHQKIDSFEGNVTITGVGDVPITSSKEAQAKVSVRNRETIILGGLIETDKSSNKSGIPLLMDIPGLGFLFRASSTTETRNELIVLIRPTVLPTPEIAALTAESEKSKMSGIRSTEKELRGEEQKRLEQQDKEDAKEARKHKKTSS